MIVTARPYGSERAQLAAAHLPSPVRVHSPRTGPRIWTEVGRINELPDDLRELIDDYLEDAIDERRLKELEARLRADIEARRYFASSAPTRRARFAARWC
jgi:hypothetical protein